MQQSLTKQLLLSSNYWVLNKTVVRIFGLETAFLLSNFAEAEQMMADKEGWFYQTSDTVEEMTTLSRHKQDQCIKQLEEMNVLFKDVRGMPAKRYFKINYQCLTNLIVKNSQTRLSKISKQDCKKSATNKESSYKELNYKESIKEDLQQPCKDNSKPTYKYDANSEEVKTAKFMVDELIRIKEDSKVPSSDLKGLQSWAKQIDYLIRIDKREPRHICELFRWAQEDSFWTSNIRSPKKLREKWDTLEIQMEKDIGGYKNGKHKSNSGQDEYAGLGWSFEDMQQM